MKPKKYEEAKYIATPRKTLNGIKYALYIMLAAVIIMCLLGIIVGARLISLSVEYETLKREKESLEDLAEMQSSMIGDLEENCKDLYIELEGLKEKYVY